MYAVQQQVDGGLSDNEISQQLSNEDRRQNPPQTDSLRDEASTDSQQYCHLSFPDIHAALRELTATVTEQKVNIRVLEKTAEQQMVILEDLNKKNDGTSLTNSLFLSVILRVKHNCNTLHTVNDSVILSVNCVISLL